MRIAHVTATFPPYLGGTGNVAYHHALELAKRGHELRVVTAAAGPLDGVTDPPDVQIFRLASRLKVGNAPWLAGLDQALIGMDVVHLHYPFYFGGEKVWRFCARTRTPFVVTYHQDVLLPFPGSLIAELHHALVGRRLLRAAAVLSATSEDYAAASRLARMRVEAIPNGVDTSRFMTGLDGSSIRARHDISADAPLALFVGALDRPHYFKGLPGLLEALAWLPDAALLVVGDGELRPSYERQARELGIAERVHFAGRVSEAELALHYAAADVTVLPSVTRGEAFGLVLVEAMACGRPVVATSLPGVRTVVQDGVTGLLAPPGDVGELTAKLQEMLSNRTQAARMGTAARRDVEARFSWARIAAQWEHAYERALRGAPALAGASRA
jgi:glycosyltransferase involved in cell wall biosynthesis